jgi:hypothetical protein
LFDLIQVTEDHFIFLKEEDVKDEGKPAKLTVVKLIRDRNFRSMIVLDDWIYAKTEMFKAYDNRPEVDWPVGRMNVSGFYATSLSLLTKETTKE